MIVTFCHIFFLYPIIFYIGRKNICNACYYHEFDYILRERFRSIFQKFKCTSTLKGATILRNLN